MEQQPLDWEDAPLMIETTRHRVERISAELLEMQTSDQRMRQAYVSKQADWDKSVDAGHLPRIKAIVEACGWPTISEFGAEAAHAAWLLVQHAAEPVFMKHCLELMQQADEGEVSPLNMAFLEDRIHIMEHRPQRFGTQFYTVDDVTWPYPVDSIDTVNQRRAALGLNSFDENLIEMQLRATKRRATRRETPAPDQP
ncbi:MAG: hypothetical protein JWN38_1064 [Candidatus Saccharibacteria bacterium]|nr:hypothetical protein [Candidatus Saccharibacteria bacterium]